MLLKMKDLRILNKKTFVLIHQSRTGGFINNNDSKSSTGVTVSKATNIFVEGQWVDQYVKTLVNQEKRKTYKPTKG